MPSVNKVFLIGNLTRDPELRYTPNGTAVCDLGLAVNRRYTNGAGEVKEDVLFITVVAWSKQAEAAAEYLVKGSPIHVEGRLQSRSWETKEGDKRTTIEVVGERLQFLGRKPTAAGTQDPTDAPHDEVPF